MQISTVQHTRIVSETPVPTQAMPAEVYLLVHSSVAVEAIRGWVPELASRGQADPHETDDPGVHGIEDGRKPFLR